MRGSTAIALSIGIGALIGATAMGVPSIRHRIIPAHTNTAATTATATADVQAVADTAPAAAPAPAAKSTFDVKAALQDRVLGNPDAPVVFYDYSSLSCPHCALFHTTTLIQIRRHYIDTGKVKMVFRPFPLNEPALRGEQIARCVPADQYFKTLDLLFKNQDKWVFAPNVQDALRQMTKDIPGVNDAMFEACMANKELEEGIMKIGEQGVARHNLKGTPSFVMGSDMPNSDVMAGEISFERFSEKLDALLAQQDPAAATQP